jgi:Xaa-Pro aminopeptidase
MALNLSGNHLDGGYGGQLHSWMSDMTRTFAIGEVPEIAHRAHRLSIDICNAIAGTARPGTPCADLYALAEEMVKKNGLADFFMEQNSRPSSWGTV